jgi:hypothetical protein
MNDMVAGCKKADGSKYVLSVKGGRQNSPEGHHQGIDFVWVMEFEVSEGSYMRGMLLNWIGQNKADAYYYLDDDPVHQDFKVSQRGRMIRRSVELYVGESQDRRSGGS